MPHLDAERVSVVKEWITLWADSLHTAGVPREKIFCHIAFTDQGLGKADARESYAVKVAFATPEVAFSAAYRPGFSTYTEGSTFKEIHAAVAAHGSPGWISAEGTNVSPTSMPGEPTMETYLARTFNHGGVLVNVFSWGIGGEAQRGNFFRKATENPEALAAYAKFLNGQTLIESAPTEGLPQKMQKIQRDLPAWVQGHVDRKTKATALMRQLQERLKAKDYEGAGKVADSILKMIGGNS